MRDQSEEKDWLVQRGGNFTGSRIADFMGCDRSVSKLSWEDPKKIAGFGATAIKYVFQVMGERKTGFLNQEASSKQMAYGKENEEKVLDILINDGIFDDILECEFMHSEEAEFLGATPDGVCLKDGTKKALEVKSCVSWDGMYKRLGVEKDEKHPDFWQWQSEMHVLGFNELVYVVAYPMQHKTYETYTISRSDIHIDALVCRVGIANEAIKNCHDLMDLKNQLSIASSLWLKTNS